MSDYATKLEAPVTSPGTVARQKLASLLTRWGRTTTAEDWTKVELILVETEHGREYWHREGPGVDAWWRLERSE